MDNKISKLIKGSKNKKAIKLILKNIFNDLDSARIDNAVDKLSGTKKYEIKYNYDLEIKGLEENFDMIFNLSNEYIIIFFYSNDCIASKNFLQKFNDLSKKYKKLKQLFFHKIDVIKYKKILEKYEKILDIKKIPKIIVFKKKISNITFSFDYEHFHKLEYAIVTCLNPDLISYAKNIQTILLGNPNFNFFLNMLEKLVLYNSNITFDNKDNFDYAYGISDLLYVSFLEGENVKKKIIFFSEIHNIVSKKTQLDIMNLKFKNIEVHNIIKNIVDYNRNIEFKLISESDPRNVERYDFQQVGMIFNLLFLIYLKFKGRDKIFYFMAISNLINTLFPSISNFNIIRGNVISYIYNIVKKKGIKNYGSLTYQLIKKSKLKNLEYEDVIFRDYLPKNLIYNNLVDFIKVFFGCYDPYNEIYKIFYSILFIEMNHDESKDIKNLNLYEFLDIKFWNILLGIIELPNNLDEKYEGIFIKFKFLISKIKNLIIDCKEKNITYFMLHCAIYVLKLNNIEGNSHNLITLLDKLAFFISKEEKKYNKEQITIVNAYKDNLSKVDYNIESDMTNGDELKDIIYIIYNIISTLHLNLKFLFEDKNLIVNCGKSHTITFKILLDQLKNQDDENNLIKNYNELKRRYKERKNAELDRYEKIFLYDFNIKYEDPLHTYLVEDVIKYIEKNNKFLKINVKKNYNFTSEKITMVLDKFNIKFFDDNEDNYNEEIFYIKEQYVKKLNKNIYLIMFPKIEKWFVLPSNDKNYIPYKKIKKHLYDFVDAEYIE